MHSRSSWSVLGLDKKRSLVAPANQSRFAGESGPPQLLETATLRAGQVCRRREMERSKCDCFCWAIVDWVVCVLCDEGCGGCDDVAGRGIVIA